VNACGATDGAWRAGGRVQFGLCITDLTLLLPND
jgi:hypothetical protein